MDALGMARKMRSNAPASQSPQEPPEQEQNEVVDLPYLMKMEEETIEDYQKFLETTQDPQIQQQIAAILKDEQEHYSVLQGLAGQGSQEQAPQNQGQGQEQGQY